MSTALRFVDHPAFHRSFLAISVGAAVGGAAMTALGGIEAPALVGGAIGALAGLSWAESPRSAARMG
ncbi:MAG: hypothetical protein K8M05_36335, partial [Deltaproteobacteria bacterium]|nr:hypothetical protein [Kofleriaceae bacterium]